MSLRLLQLLKTSNEIVFSPSERMTSVRLLHPSKAYRPKVSTEEGTSKEVMFLQPENAEFAISLVPSGIMYDVNPEGAKALIT